MAEIQIALNLSGTSLDNQPTNGTATKFSVNKTVKLKAVSLVGHWNTSVQVTYYIWDALGNKLSQATGQMVAGDHNRVALPSALTLQANTDYYLSCSPSGSSLWHRAMPNHNQPFAVSASGVTVTVKGKYTVSAKGAFPSGSPDTNPYNQPMFALYIEPNNPPTLTLTNPANNQVLSEGNTYSVGGSATDVDNGNVVTIKYKINNGTTRALNSGVSNGSTPISFSKNLTYHDKRLWEGATDVTGVDLAENTNHTLYVWAEDDQGGVTSQATRTFTVIHNRPPTISGSDTNLGTISTPPTVNYSVTDPEGQSFTITEYLNGQQTNSFAGVAGQQYSITIDQDTWLRLALGVQHTIKVRATDSNGLYSERIFTFTRTETQIIFTLKNPFHCDAKPLRVLVTLDAVIPSGATYQVEACNNAYDASPTWEDITGPVSAGRGYIFTNEIKTATDWGISIRFTFNKGTATEPILINGFGGAFD